MPVPESPEREPRRGSRCGGNAAVFITLSVFGLVQIVSSVAVLLHLTGLIPQADSSTLRQRPTKVVLTEPVPTDTFGHTEARTAPKSPRKHRNITPAVHLPIKPAGVHTQMFVGNLSLAATALYSQMWTRHTSWLIDNICGKIHATIIHWNPEQGNLQHFGYQNGRILVQKSGLYYIYAKTCFRYYDVLDAGSESAQGSPLKRSPTISPADEGVQLIQYVFLERLLYSSPSRLALLMKSGNTWRWKRGTYHMCCQQQSGVFSLRTGEGLYVSVSNSWMLDPEAEGSYFGAFRISSEM